MTGLSKGFTLIEMLVVIGIMGILLAALIAIVDPIEQLDKAHDANTQDTSVEFVNATTRYYITHKYMPWENDTACSDELNSGNILINMPHCTADLINDGELQKAFPTATAITSQIYVSDKLNPVTACFIPQSKSRRNDATTRYDQFGLVQSGCPSLSGATVCYWCTW